MLGFGEKRWSPWNRLGSLGRTVALRSQSLSEQIASPLIRGVDAHETLLPCQGRYPAKDARDQGTRLQKICYAESEMRRSFNIAIALMAILLLARPFDCFASGKFDRKAADCCTKGKCHQSADSDPCCKASLPDGNHFVSGKAADHSSPQLAVISVQVPSLAPPQPIEAPSTAVSHPPPRGRTTANLPLLI
jgi:hypothetical protein